MLSNSVIERNSVAAVELPAAKLELVELASTAAANAGDIQKDRALQRRLRRERRQARAVNRIGSGWTTGLW